MYLILNIPIVLSSLIVSILYSCVCYNSLSLIMTDPKDVRDLTDFKFLPTAEGLRKVDISNEMWIWQCRTGIPVTYLPTEAMTDSFSHCYGRYMKTEGAISLRKTTWLSEYITADYTKRQVWLWDLMIVAPPSEETKNIFMVWKIERDNDGLLPYKSMRSAGAAFQYARTNGVVFREAVDIATMVDVQRKGLKNITFPLNNETKDVNGQPRC
jgi:hypothetical protein